LSCLPNSLPQFSTSDAILTPASFHGGLPAQQPSAYVHLICSISLLHKLSLAHNSRPTRASVLSGYTDSVVGKVLILPPKQVHQESEPIEGVRFLEPSIAAIVHHAPQPLASRQPLRVTCDILMTTGRPCLADVGPR
jgi:hypothetical protein